ncbi:MAG: ferric reductase-like transmembrane domain-containing protein [Sphingomonadales bacterium]|nr:ferric reductase-like transmembrane domain-containing protein [Sphingomonadales bacterium]
MTDQKRLALAFAALPLLLTCVWAIGLKANPFAGGFWAIRNVALYYTGILAIGFLSAAVMLAARPVQFESLLGGLDKYYRLHKWFGIAGASLGVVHWLIEILPRSFVSWGWVAARVRRPRPPIEAATGFDPFRDLHEPAVSVGEWVLYLLVALVIVALWKRFPYRYFFKVHRVLAALYLVLVFHAVILLGPAYWSVPVGPLLGALMAGASLAALTSLFRRIGKNRRATGAIEQVEHHQDSGVIEVTVRLETAWPGHRAGQFAFVDARERQELGGLPVGLGDYTRALPDRLFPGQTVAIEGPYGRFDFRTGGERQLWIAGGIGITPFMAGLEMLVEGAGQADVDLIYSTRMRNERLMRRLQALADRTGARLHLLVTPPDEPLTVDRLETMVPDWRSAEVWFCGPAPFGEALREAMQANGLPAGRFHQELFAMR